MKNLLALRPLFFIVCGLLMTAIGLGRIFASAPLYISFLIAVPLMGGLIWLLRWAFDLD